MNKVTITGRLGRDPELKNTPDGKSVCKFSVAVNNWKKETAWYRVTAWGTMAENAAKYLTKGSQVLVEGELQFDGATGSPKIFTKQNGNVGTSFEINANTIEYLSRGEASDSSVGEYEAESAVEETEEVPF